jgi:hypothetical protein
MGSPSKIDLAARSYDNVSRQDLYKEKAHSPFPVSLEIRMKKGLHSNHCVAVEKASFPSEIIT